MEIIWGIGKTEKHLSNSDSEAVWKVDGALFDSRENVTAVLRVSQDIRLFLIGEIRWGSSKCERENEFESVFHLSELSPWPEAHEEDFFSPAEKIFIFFPEENPQNEKFLVQSQALSLARS